MRYVLAFLVFLWPAGQQALAGDALPSPSGPVLLTVTGLIERTNAPGQARFDRAMLEGLGKTTIVTSVPDLDGVRTFDGISLKALLERVGATGNSLKASALNDYEADLPLKDLEYEPILATHMDQQLLTPYDKGPLWIVYPRDDYSELKDIRFEKRWVWQLKSLHVEQK